MFMLSSPRKRTPMLLRPSRLRYPTCPNTACVDDNKRTMVRATHARNKKMQADIVTMNSVLAKVFLKAMLSQVRASSQQRRLRKPNIVFVDLFLWFVNQYGKKTVKDREANRQRMAAN